jgi:hypothetical protein
VKAASAERFHLSGDDTGRARRGSLIVGGLAISIAGAYAATLVVTGPEPLVVAPLIGAVIGIVIFARPEVGLYLLVGTAIAFEQWEITGLAPLTAQTHFFQNISGYSDLPLRFSASDLLTLLTCVSWATRRAVGANAPARGGPFGWAVGLYGLTFVFGAVVGAARGGTWDGIAALAEARGPVYACLLYFLATNMIRTRGQLVIILWELVLLIGLKAVQAIGNYAEMLNGPYRLEAVTAHEDVVFFDVAVGLALVGLALHLRGKLFYLLLAMQPVIMTAELLTERRAAFGALAVVLLLVALMSAVDRPRATLVVATVVALGFAVYAVTFWNRTGPLAEPIRVVREVVDPSSVTMRDRLSDVWREIENVNIAYTVRQLPLTGVGLGHEYLSRIEPPPLAASFVYWRFMTHNALLWMWLKAGPLGAFALWFLVARVVITGIQRYRRLRDPLLRFAASLPVLLIAAQIVFSAVDLGLTYNRTMIVLGVALGIGAMLSEWSVSRRSPDDRSPRAVRKAWPLGAAAPLGDVSPANPVRA